MINDISKLLNMNPKYVGEFMKNCSIEEKIDTHYITVHIISANQFILRKPNGDEVNRIDMILNSMWNIVSLDWNYLLVSNNDWFRKHVGYSMKMFYVPVAKPIMTEYNPAVRYIFDKAFHNETEVDVHETIDSLVFPSTYTIGFKHQLTRSECPDILVQSVLNNDISIHEAMRSLIHKDDKIYAVNEPEGYIYKMNNRLFQDADTNNRSVTTEKTSYEFLLSDFIKYCRRSEYTDKINKSYITSICNIFNDYIINVEKKTGYIENNINTDSIESPCLGNKFDIGYEYIPNPITKNLCKESLLYKNIFKVMLANLRKGKDVKHCIYLTNKEVDEWNTIVKNLKIRCSYI